MQFISFMDCRLGAPCETMCVCVCERLSQCAFDCIPRAARASILEHESVSRVRFTVLSRNPEKRDRRPPHTTSNLDMIRVRIYPREDLGSMEMNLYVYI